MKSKALIAGAALLLPLAALLLWWRVAGAPPVRIAGAEAAVPRAQPESEFVLSEALQAALVAAESRKVRAFVVHRRGHRVFEYFRGGTSGDARRDGGELAAVVLELALADAEARGQSDPTAIATLVSERLWLPLRAGDAALSGAAGANPRERSIEARLDDWMRVGDLLLGTGSYLGERIASADAVRALLAARTLQWQGDEPLLAPDGAAFELSPGLRLWLAPRRQLAILVWAGADVATDTLLPNIVLRGLNDPAPALGGGISDIVPGH